MISSGIMSSQFYLFDKLGECLLVAMEIGKINLIMHVAHQSANPWAQKLTLELGKQYNIEISKL